MTEPDALHRAFDAGRYAAYVWPAYAATLGGFAWMAIVSFLRAHHWRRRVETLEKQRDAKAD